MLLPIINWLGQPFYFFALCWVEFVSVSCCFLKVVVIKKQKFEFYSMDEKVNCSGI